MTEENKQDSKETFVKLMKYSTPVTVVALILVGYMLRDSEPILLGIIGVLIGLEILTGLKAEALYDAITPSDAKEDTDSHSDNS